MPHLSENRLKKCEICGKIIPVYPCMIERRKYCSRHCLGVANGLRFNRDRLARIELIKSGADLPIPRKSHTRKYGPVDPRIDPDEPTPDKQEEFNKRIEALRASRRAREEYFNPDSREKK
jgi:hypothetical protein